MITFGYTLVMNSIRRTMQYHNTSVMFTVLSCVGMIVQCIGFGSPWWSVRWIFASSTYTALGFSFYDVRSDQLRAVFSILLLSIACVLFIIAYARHTHSLRLQVVIQTLIFISGALTLTITLPYTVLAIGSYNEEQIEYQEFVPTSLLITLFGVSFVITNGVVLTVKNKTMIEARARQPGIAMDDSGTSSTHALTSNNVDELTPDDTEIVNDPVEKTKMGPKARWRSLGWLSLFNCFAAAIHIVSEFTPWFHSTCDLDAYEVGGRLIRGCNHRGVWFYCKCADEFRCAFSSYFDDYCYSDEYYSLCHKRIGFQSLLIMATVGIVISTYMLTITNNRINAKHNKLYLYTGTTLIVADTIIWPFLIQSTAETIRKIIEDSRRSVVLVPYSLIMMIISAVITSVTAIVCLKRSATEPADNANSNYNTSELLS